MSKSRRSKDRKTKDKNLLTKIISDTFFRSFDFRSIDPTLFNFPNKKALILHNFRLFHLFSRMFQIHSLTARSVPRHFREGLKKSMPEKTTFNRNVKTTTLHSDDISPTTDQQRLEDMTSFKNDLLVTSPNVGSRQKVTSSNLHIIYDSRKQDDPPYPEAEIVRTPSPEHVGIPAGPLRMPIRNRNKNSGTKNPDEYTSDESTGPPRNRHPPQNRRKKSTQQI